MTYEEYLNEILSQTEALFLSLPDGSIEEGQYIRLVELAARLMAEAENTDSPRQTNL